MKLAYTVSKTLFPLSLISGTITKKERAFTMTTPLIISHTFISIESSFFSLVLLLTLAFIPHQRILLLLFQNLFSITMSHTFDDFTHRYF